MRSSLALLLPALLLPLAQAPAAPWPEFFVSVKGKLSCAGAPARQVSVQLRSREPGGRPLDSASTDATGYFQLFGALRSRNPLKASVRIRHSCRRNTAALLDVKVPADFVFGDRGAALHKFFFVQLDLAKT